MEEYGHLISPCNSYGQFMLYHVVLVYIHSIPPTSIHKQHYREVVAAVEKFGQTCPREYKLPTLYVVDAVARAAHRAGNHEAFVRRFEERLESMFQYFAQAEEKDKVSCVIPRVLSTSTTRFSSLLAQDEKSRYIVEAKWHV